MNKKDIVLLILSVIIIIIITLNVVIIISKLDIPSSKNIVLFSNSTIKAGLNETCQTNILKIKCQKGLKCSSINLYSENKKCIKIN